jgi:HEAT repeat protein
LARALTDPNLLVRVQAAESIGTRVNQRTRTALRRALNDKSPLVRSYVAAALGRTGGHSDRMLLRRRVVQERYGTAKLGFLEGLWLIGDRSVFADALRLVENRDYRVRCAAASALAFTFFNRHTRERIVAALRERLRRETTVAARSTIVRSLARIGRSLTTA